MGFCYITLRRYPDAIRVFVQILNFILRMRQYHTRSYQYDQVRFSPTTSEAATDHLCYQINKTADRMYALFAICNALSPSRLDDNILNIVKDRYGDQFAKLSRGCVLLLSHQLRERNSPFVCQHSDEGLPAFEELFLYACPKFISANPPPYEDQEQLAAYAEDLPPEPAQRHLALFLADVRAQAAVPTLRSFLKLYTSLDAAKLAGFLDADEEEMVQQMMAVKAASRSVSRVGSERNLLDGQMISTSDMDFVINEVTSSVFPARAFACLGTHRVEYE